MKPIDIEHYYKVISQIKITGENEKEWYAFCPFHDDKKRSLSINKERGLWNCQGACQEGGNIYQFHAKLRKVPIKEAEEELAKMFGGEVVPKEEVEEKHQILLENKSIITFLKKKRGINLKSIKHWALGWDGSRIWIPIKEGENYANVRRYDYTGKLGDKMVSYAAGYGKIRLWPMENLDKKEILLCEGEMDCILANQVGYNAVTVTGGANSFQDGFTEAFRGKKVSICYDLDEAGKEGARRVASKIFPVASEVRIVHLPSNLPPGSDFTNFIVDKGNDRGSFDALLSKAELFTVFFHGKEIGEEIWDCSLGEASADKYFLKRIRMKAIVAGKDLCPYFSPRRVTLKCPMTSKKCRVCSLGEAGGRMTIEFNPDNPSIIKMIRCSEDQQEGIIREIMNLPKCQNIEVTIEDVWNIEQLRVIPEIEYSSRESEFIAREIFCIGQGVITNRSYSLEGITIPDPKSQYSTQLINRITPAQTLIDTFQTDREVLKRLKVFQP